jgi:peptidoglycan/LPS O-acetylase OafA/YrhL
MAMIPAPAAPMNDGRISGLDGLRVLAVLTVLLYHQKLVPFGWAGVQFFFVLSGYLITRLLWAARDQPLRSYLTGFYGRRALRIFPLYYGALALLCVAAIATGRAENFMNSLPYLATYTFNLWRAVPEIRGTESVGHFWSLCVEEQFYLVWPFVIFFCRERLVRPFLIALALAGPLVRLLEVLWAKTWAGPHSLDWIVYLLTPTYFDAFAMGAFVALFPLGGRIKLWCATFVATIVVVAAVLSTANGVRDEQGMGPGYILLWGYGLVNLCAALTIDCLAFRKLAPGFFDSAPMQYLGKISYGLYVFHVPVQLALERALPQAPLYARLVAQIVLTIVIAGLSYRYWEKPFLGMKDRWFPTGKQRDTRPLAVSAERA